MKILERKQKDIAKFRLLGSIVFLSMVLYIVWLLHLGNYTITTYKYIDYIDPMVASSQQESMQFIFVDDDRTEYKVFQENIHGAWINWDFLFGSSGDDGENNTENNTTSKTWSQQNIPNKNYVDDLINDIKNDLDRVTIRPKYKTCTLPRWEKIKHEEYVLAYQQRGDEPSICNVQKRYCDNGMLSGTYPQRACKEPKHNAYENITLDPSNLKMNTHHFVVHHKKSKDLLTQSQYRPNKYDPRIIEKNHPNTIWNNAIKGTPQKDYQQNTTNWTHHRDCTAPRWAIVNHGQFVKAYKRSKVFHNDTCEVELRICLDGVLQWNFKHKKCKHRDR